MDGGVRKLNFIIAIRQESDSFYRNVTFYLKQLTVMF